MKRLVPILLLCAAPAAASEPAAVADLAWMAGDWVQETDDMTVQETWSAPYRGGMAAVGQSHKPGKPTSYEFMTITTEPAGVTFTAYVAGQPPTPFLLKPGERGLAEFENRGHDFPQRVIYRKCDADLCARVEGMVDGKLKGMDWRYRRTR